MTVRRATGCGLVWVVGLLLFLPALSVYAAPPPTVSGIAPTSGTVAGGTMLTITGTGFVAGATVTFGGYAAVAVAVPSATQITVRTLAHAVGSTSVVVTNPDTQSAASPTNFNDTAIATATPTITEFSAGIPAGSNPHGITAGPDGNLWFTEESNISIGKITTAGAVTEFQDTQKGAPWTAIAAGPDGDLWFAESNDRIARAVLAPVVTAATPRSGPTTGGTSVTLTGAGFGTTATTQVFIDGTAIPAASITSVTGTGTQIVYLAPAHAVGSVTVTVSVGGTTLTGSAMYTYGEVTPLPTTLRPSSGTTGSPNPVPGSHPGGTTGGPAPNPQPVARP